MAGLTVLANRGVNDDGGGIVGLLEQCAPEYAGAFERIFGTPHGTDLAALCAAHHVGHVRVPPGEAADVVAPAPGLRVVEVRTERTGLRALHDQIRTAVAVAVAPFVGERA